MVWGLTLAHGPGHLFRAILEGICYGTELIFQTMREAGFEPTETRVAGGPTNSVLWMQMHADVTSSPLSIMRNGDAAPVLGSAMLAAVGAGVHTDIASAARHMVHVDRTVEPDAEAHERYAFYFDRYVRSYERMRELMAETSRHVADSG
jgi:sugar (pentulose or hexulose) kinase